MVAFGRPVVPEVNPSCATSSAAVGTGVKSPDFAAPTASAASSP